MAIRLREAARAGCLIGKMLLIAALITWVAMAPLVWILRDGLAVGMIETTGTEAVFKFLVGWGVPALCSRCRLSDYSCLIAASQPNPRIVRKSHE
jgi:hypothetical protein